MRAPILARPRSATIAAIVLALAIFVIGAVLSPGFTARSNLAQLAVFASFIGIAALGQTFVIIGGGLDLSVPWVIALGGIGLSLLTQHGIPGPVALLVMLAVGTLIGAANGFGVAWMNVTPIVMTLAVGGLVQAYLLAVGLLKSQGNGAPGIAVDLATTRWIGIPMPALIWLGLALLAAFALQQTALGRRVYASGANVLVATYSGIDVRRTKLLTYCLSGFTSVFAGVLLSGYVGTTYVTIGGPYLFSTIAAVVVGGASILGGSGTYWGTFFGAVTLTVLGAVLPLFHLSDAQLKIAYGLVIIVGVTASTSGGTGMSALRRRLRPSPPRPEETKPVLGH